MIVPTPRWIWVAVAVMVLCVIGYIIVGISASQRLTATAPGTMPQLSAFSIRPLPPHCLHGGG
jgi:uncharacterized protein YneF (UPF0154 family)